MHKLFQAPNIYLFINHILRVFESLSLNSYLLNLVKLSYHGTLQNLVGWFAYLDHNLAPSALNIENRNQL